MQIVSNANGRVIGSNFCHSAGTITIVKDPDPTDETQLWACIFYPEQEAFALVTMYNNSAWALSMTPDIVYPQLTAYKEDTSYLWQLGQGISPVRDSGYCLTMEGAGEGEDPWPVGTRIQAYNWKGNYDNQKWSIKKIAGEG